MGNITPPPKKKKNMKPWWETIHQAAEDLERIEPVLSLEGRLESSPRQGKKPWVLGRKPRWFTAYWHEVENNAMMACSFFRPKKQRNKQKEGELWKQQNAEKSLFGCGLTFWSKEVLNLFFFRIYINLFPPPRLTQNAKFRTFYRAVTSWGGGSNYRPKKCLKGMERWSLRLSFRYFTHPFL